ncbi:ORF6C domain-containing protein [Clostridium perfringens]|uniref:ORF6C domain-containing protein n=1 Tax=Clostridium perfringens TaxID=1502 RepID=UPI002ED100B6|nr:ORF6C domain-containing protein [Clostridium perfringens]WVM77511.1 ORF6C domain-containing protein [Clostridium perfringens]
MSNLMVFENKELDVEVRTIKNEDGSISINAEDAALGFGWYQIKNNKRYVKWERVNSFISEFENSPLVGKDDFIPESLFYLLGMKANNDVAKKFQTWLAVDVIPSVRKNGHYEVKKKSSLDLLELQVKALKEVEEKVTDLDEKFEDFKEDLPLIGDEPDELVALVKQKGVEVLGGKGSKAYKDKSLRSKVYSDIWGEVKRQFGVRKYKAIKRKHFNKAKEIINKYDTTVLLAEEISLLNDQIDLLRG